jgi:hypothetical protein
MTPSVSLVILVLFLLGTVLCLRFSSSNPKSVHVMQKNVKTPRSGHPKFKNLRKRLQYKHKKEDSRDVPDVEKQLPSEVHSVPKDVEKQLPGKRRKKVNMLV